MRSRTIKEVLKSDKGISPEMYELYLVKADGIVLYAGQAENAYNRLLSHLGQNRGGITDILGDCLYANRPRSYEWIFEEYTVEDCRQMSMEWRMDKFGIGAEMFPVDKCDAESAMIRKYRPPLNTMLNPHPNPLPKEYEWRDCYINDENKHASQLLDFLGIE